MVNWFLLGVALCASLAWPAEVHGQSVKATVISIGDGDTIRVRASRRGSGVWQLPGGITRPWDFRRSRNATAFPDGTTPGGRRYRCSEIGSYARAQELLRQGHTYLDSNKDGEACESLRR
jgi:hypothetical protein